MTPARLEWTVTASEQDALLRAATWRLWRGTARLVLLLGGALALLGSARWNYPGLLLGVGGAALMAAWFWLSTRRSVRRVLGAAYPVGAAVASEATAERLRLETAAGDSELPWERLTRIVAGPVVVTAWDAPARQWLTVPRQLVPDAWLDPDFRKPSVR
ncbi:hypothetical protein GCM10022237_14330 [Nocardioides ginsengisoli]|uniref:Uncharacterized protein n=1 Tax=Nocardioides ginsengisoli TaxID=363868 RepID=A0ABW3W189_9ACTN